MKKYKVVLFDSDQTLLDFNASERCALELTFKHFNIEFNEERLQRYSDFNHQAWSLYEQGELTAKQLMIYRFELLCKYLSINLAPEEINSYYMNELSKTDFVLKDTIEVLNALYKKYPMYIVSNGDTYVQKSRLKNSGLYKYFDGVFTSQEVGAQKPEPAFFEKVYSAIPFLPEESLLVGDSLSSDIEGGIGFGIDTCYFNPDQKPSGEIHPTYEIKSLKELIDLLK